MFRDRVGRRHARILAQEPGTGRKHSAWCQSRNFRDEEPGGPREAFGLSSTALTDSPPPHAHHRPRIRLTAILGCLAAIGVAVGFFLDWATVRPEFAEKYRAAVVEHHEREFTPSPTADDWKALADHLVAHGGVSGPDVFHWARTARATAARLRETEQRAEAQRVDVERERTPGDPADPGAVTSDAPSTDRYPRDPLFERAMVPVATFLAFVPIGAAFVAFYFLLHGLRRARTPVLVLAMWVGVIAVSFPAAYRIAEGAIDLDTDPAPGLSVLLVSGFALFLAGVFGVKAENWWRVFLGFLVVGVLVGALGYAYIRWGTVS